MRNVQVGQVADAAVHIDFHYEEGAAGSFKPVVRNIDVRGVTCKKSKYALALRGFADAPIRNVRLTGCRFENVAKANIVEHVEGLSLEDVVIKIAG
jgi:hypothetical protein